MVYVDHSQPGMAIIHVGPNPQHERHNAIPDGVDRAEIWEWRGGVPDDSSRWRFLRSESGSPYHHTVLPGTKVAYRARWADKHERRGPFGEPFEVIVSV